MLSTVHYAECHVIIDMHWTIHALLQCNPCEIGLLPVSHPALPYTYSYKYNAD
jgi:hypothetical protein